MSPIQVFEGVISKIACRSILEAMDRVQAVPGTVLRNGCDDLDHRLRVCTEHPLPDTFYVELLTAIREVTSKMLMDAGLQVGQLDGPKFCRYGTGNFFRPHRDNSEAVLDPEAVRTRRLSVVCFLNDADPSTGLPAFDGGALVVYVNKLEGLEPVVIRPKAGSIVVFQSDLLHEVRPVKSGIRYSAIGWIHSLVK